MLDLYWSFFFHRMGKSTYTNLFHTIDNQESESYLYKYIKHSKH